MPVDDLWKLWLAAFAAAARALDAAARDGVFDRNERARQRARLSAERETVARLLWPRTRPTLET